MARPKKKPAGTPEPAQAAAAMDNTTQAPPGENTTGEAAPKKRGRPRKQPDLPGIQGKGVERNALLEDLSAEYNTAKVNRCNMTAEETRTREALLAGMKAEGVAEYEWDGKVFYIAHKDETDTIKERKKKSPDYEAVGSDEGGEDE